jgi:hypothetical protein
VNGEWTPSDAAGLNEFLNTQLGRKWLGVMLAHKPRLDLSSTEKAALTGAFVAGYEHLLFAEMSMNRNAGVVPGGKEAASKKGIDPEKD